MNAFRMTKKESTWKNNKVMVLFQNPKKRMEEEKGRALQSKLFPILIFFLVQSSLHIHRPVASKPNLRTVPSRSKMKGINDPEQDEEI